MTSSSQKDLWLVIVLSLVGLALIWLLPSQSNSFTLITYFLLLFLPGYSLISIIKPQYDFLNKIIIGFLLGLFFLYLILVVAAYLNMNYLNGLLTSLLFLLAIIFSLLALHQRRTKYKEGQLTLDESLRRIQEIKKRSEEVSLSEEMEEYTPMPEEVEEASLKNRMSVMRLYDTGKKPEGEKNSQQLKDFLDKKPIRDEILRVKQEEKSGEKTIPLPIEHAVKREDLLSVFQNEMGRPVWLDHMDEEPSGFRNWDLLLVLLISGLSVLLLYYNPLVNPLVTIILSYTSVLFTMTYTLLVAIFPARTRIRLLYRLIISSILTIILLALFLFYGNTIIITSLPIPLIMLISLATLILVFVTALRRRSLTPESAELSLQEIIRRSEKMGIIIEHDEETIQAMKELEKETEETPPDKDEKQLIEEEALKIEEPPEEEVPVIIVEHDQEDQVEYGETIIIDHEDEEKTDETPYIIVEHDQEDSNEYERESIPQVPKKETKSSPLFTEINETESVVPPKKKVKTDPKVTSKKIPKTKVKKKEINPIKEQYNLNDLILINVSACLLIIYFIIPLFLKTPLTVMIANVLLFILAGYTIIATLYPKKYNIKKLVTGIILGILLFFVYQIVLFYGYINFFIENIVLWLLIFILVLSLITYYRRERADREEKKHFQNYNQNPNLINLVNNVIQERDQNKKISPAHKEDTFQYLRSRADEKKQTNNKTTAGKSTNKRPETIIILSIILIAILVTAISATTIYIIKP